MATAEIQVGSIVTLQVGGVAKRYVCEEIQTDYRIEKLAREDHDYYRTCERSGNVKILDHRVGVFYVGDVIVVELQNILLVNPELGPYYIRPKYWVYKKGDNIEQQRPIGREAEGSGTEAEGARTGNQSGESDGRQSSGEDGSTVH